MTRLLLAVLCVTTIALPTVAARAQEAEPKAETGDGNIVGDAAKKVGDAAKNLEDLSKQVDDDERAKEITAGILQPIYVLAEAFSFAAFHWIAFMLMVTGVVSFALQLVLGKLIALAKLGLTLMEVLTDTLGLLISLIGLVLTTQAAAENSTFTSSPASVLSATIVGVLFGLIFYRWGQTQELQAMRGRSLEKGTVTKT